jgi:hypothetical protein
MACNLNRSEAEWEIPKSKNTAGSGNRKGIPKDQAEYTTAFNHGLISYLR